ncbi:MAG: hypothetical protein IPP17_14540 [Bacteroidetes bacterium]|nr:hypothetical protein [Bacteroidota bacterium]
MNFHGADHGFSWCRPWIFMVSTMDFHGADHGFSWCRPWIFMDAMVFKADHGLHGVDHGRPGC